MLPTAIAAVVRGGRRAQPPLRLRRNMCASAGLACMSLHEGTQCCMLTTQCAFPSAGSRCTVEGGAPCSAFERGACVFIDNSEYSYNRAAKCALQPKGNSGPPPRGGSARGVHALGLAAERSARLRTGRSCPVRARVAPQHERLVSMRLWSPQHAMCFAIGAQTPSLNDRVWQSTSPCAWVDLEVLDSVTERLSPWLKERGLEPPYNAETEHLLLTVLPHASSLSATACTVCVHRRHQQLAGRERMSELRSGGGLPLNLVK